MAVPLLTTKLYIPLVRPDLVPRPRLLERLNAGSRAACKLMLISAPAGFGKTTLLSEWIDQCRLRARVAWLSLDEGDNDLVRFLSYVFAALQTVSKNIRQDLLDALPSSQPPGWAELVTELINQVNTIPDRLILVLDDYHHVTAQPVHDVVTFLLDHLPANLHLVIATRADPPLPIPRLRGRGQLAELRLNDLRFTADEAAAFLENFGLKLVAEDITALNARAEGWAAGLQMAAASMQGQHDVSGFIQSFTGSSHHILDYLVEEVLQRQPEHIQAFLLQTSILDRLCGSLCDAVSGPDVALPTSGQSILESLEHANLFIVPLDDHCEWYRYHRLFADLLNLRLHQLQPELIPVLHHRASVWYEQHGLMEDAIEHAMSGRDVTRAAELIEQAAEATLMRSQVVTFLHWVDQLPEQEIRAHPTLSVYHAWALLWNGAPIETVEKRLATAAGAADFSGKAAALQATMALFRSQYARAGELARQALEQLPESQPLLRSLATLMQANSLLGEGDVVAGVQALEQAVQISQKTGNVLFAALVLCNLGDLRQKQGRLRQAQTLYQQAVNLATDVHGRRLPVAGRAMIGLADLAREWNDLDAAARLLTEGISLSKQASQLAVFNGYLTLVQLRQAQGDSAGVQEALDLLHKLARQFDVTDTDDLIVAIMEAQVKIAEGDLAAAASWAEQRGLYGDVSPADLGTVQDFKSSRLRKYEYPALARLWLAEGRNADALGLLERALPQVEQMDRPNLVIEMEILRALTYQASGKIALAFSALEHALTLAEPEGYVRTFVDEGEPLRSLMADCRLQMEKQGRDQCKSAAYMDKLLTAFPQTVPAPQPVTHRQPSAIGPLAEPLSERELDVLRLLPSDLSTTEMADQLVVSVNTLRTHLKNLYGKLGAHSRYEAIARAKELGVTKIS